MESSSSKKSNKITDIVRLQQILKKWKKLAVSPKNPSPGPAITTTAASGSCNKSINKFLKRTLSFSDDAVPKGYLAVCVGPDLQRFVIPTAYLRHQAFVGLLQEAEDEFGFHQEGVLKIPCDAGTFRKILRTVEGKESDPTMFFGYDRDGENFADRRCSSDPITPSRDHFQMCR